MKKDKVDTKELGLNVGLILGKYFLKTEDLHYGYWTDGLEITIDNFTKAQANHSNLIISHIPEGVSSILDVGCGTGSLACKLLDNNFKVDCVSPSPLLTEKLRKKVSRECELIETKFEDLDINKKYDLILFSESFQYIKLLPAIEKSLELLNQNGFILICDFFKTDAIGKSALGGGHKLTKFYETTANYDLTKITDIDITEQTAPNLKLIHDMLETVGKPIWETVFIYFEHNHPYIYRFLSWKFKKKIDKVNSRYFSGQRNDENFIKFKSYRLLIYQKQ